MTNVTFKLHKTNPSGKVSNTTKTDQDYPLEKVVPKLGKLVTRPSMKPPLSQPSVYR